MGRYFSFRGRAQRTEFWLINLTIGILALVLIALGGFLAYGAVGSGGADLQGIVSALAGPGLFLLVGIIGLGWLGYAVGARRLHDRNKSAWWLVVFFGPAAFVWADMFISGPVQAMSSNAGLAMLSTIAIIWYYVEMGCFTGTDGPNRFDEDPAAHRTVEHEEVSSWADRPIEELAASAAAAEAAEGPRVLRKRTPAVQRGSGPRGFGRRGANA